MSTRKTFNKFYGAVQPFIVDDLRYSRTVYEEALGNSVTRGCSWMDLGCGHRILSNEKTIEGKRLIQRPKLLVGLDRDLISLARHKTIKHKICGHMSRLPFRDNTFDLITSNMVFEHIEEPQIQLAEILRILKPGGKLIFHTPSKLGYTTLLARLIPRSIKAKLIYFLQRRTEDDVFPAFYRINKPATVKVFAKESGFIIEDIRSVVSGENS